MSQKREDQTKYVAPEWKVRACMGKDVITVSPYIDKNEGEWDVNGGGGNG